MIQSLFLEQKGSSRKLTTRDDASEGRFRAALGIFALPTSRDGSHALYPHVGNGGFGWTHLFASMSAGVKKRGHSSP